MNSKIRKMIKDSFLIMCIVLFLWSGYMIAVYAINHYRSKDAYDAAQNMVQIDDAPPHTTQSTEPSLGPTEGPTTPEESIPINTYDELKIAINVDWASLTTQSKDSVGWIHIPDTNISYPIVLKDNSYYLDHDYAGNRSSAGAIFLDYKQTMVSDNKIIYGHHMKSDTMFHRLPYYVEQAYADSHKYIYISTESGISIYQVFSVEYVDRLDGVYTKEFTSPEEKVEYINDAIEGSLVETNCQIDYDGELLLLSTCTGRIKTERLVVHAIKLTEY